MSNFSIVCYKNDLGNFINIIHNIIKFRFEVLCEKSAWRRPMSSKIEAKILSINAKFFKELFKWHSADIGSIIAYQEISDDFLYFGLILMDRLTHYLFVLWLLLRN